MTISLRSASPRVDHAVPLPRHHTVSTVSGASAMEWALGAAGVTAGACVVWLFAGAVHAATRPSPTVRRDNELLDKLFDGTRHHVTYRTGAGRSAEPSPVVLIAGATDRGYRLVQANRHGGRTTMEFRRAHRRSNDT